MKRIYTTDEVAELLKLDVRTIYRYIQEGRLRAAKMGRVYRISESQLEDFFNKAIPSESKSDSPKLVDDLDKIVKKLISEYNPEKIILFGSLAKGLKDAKDIDLLIIKKTKKKYFDRLEEIATICDYDIPIDFLIYTPEELEEEAKSNPFLRREVLEKGEVLYDRAA